MTTALGRDNRIHVGLLVYWLFFGVFDLNLLPRLHLFVVGEKQISAEFPRSKRPSRLQDKWGRP